MKLKRIHAPLSGLASLVVIFSGCSARVEQPEVQPQADVTAENDYDITTPKQGVFNGVSVDYIAALETLPIQTDRENSGAKIVTISYVAKAKDEVEKRPVLFIYNGGPITSSIPLHIGATGPMRVSFDDDVSIDVSKAELRANPYSPLDVADLVYFDPASTGLSRVDQGVDPYVYASVKGDAEQFVDFVRTWLKKHKREDAPIFMLGESYGTMRAAEAAGQFVENYPEVDLKGVFLMGQAVNIIEYAQRRENILSYVVSVPTLASAAWDMGRVEKDGYSFESFIEDATNFADTDYLLALYQGQYVSDQAKLDVSKKLEKYTGIPEAYYLANNIRITKEEFRRELLKDKNLLMGMSDARYLETAPEDGQHSDPSGVIFEKYKLSFGTYFEDTFGLPLPDSYVPYFSVGSLADWDWGYASPFASYAYGERLTQAFEQKPDFHLVIGNGYHDTQTTVGAARYGVAQSEWPIERVKLVYYSGGHMAYSVEESAEKFGQDIRDLVTGTSDEASE